MNKYFGWVTGLMILCGVLLVFAHFSTDDVDFSRYNTGWNGTSQFFEQARNTVQIEDLRSIGEYRNATLLIIAPHDTYSPDEITLYRSFLDRGNTIVLLDDFGTGSQLLNGIGSTIRLPGIALASADHAFENASLVRVYPTGAKSLVANISGMNLDRPAMVEGGESFLTTSFLSWADANNNFQLDRGETLGRYTTGASETLGRGEIVVIGDPSILINGMAGSDRDRFVNALFGLSPLTLIDMTNSRTSATGTTGNIIHMIQQTTFIQTIVLIAMSALVVLAFRRPDNRGK